MDAAQLRENRAMWQSIADSFHTTRGRPWKPVVDFLESLPRPSTVLDAGCGNGRHARAAHALGHRVVGLDFARALLVKARAEAPRSRWIEGVIERLPLRDASIDHVVAAAVLHHVRGRAERVAVVQELLRVVRPGGRVLVSAWSRDQPRFGPGKEPRAPQDGRPHEPGDAWVRWTQHGHDEPRFIHLFTWNEWRRELDETHARIERAWPEAIATQVDADNFFAILRK